MLVITALFLPVECRLLELTDRVTDLFLEKELQSVLV